MRLPIDWDALEDLRRFGDTAVVTELNKLEDNEAAEVDAYYDPFGSEFLFNQWDFPF